MALPERSNWHGGVQRAANWVEITGIAAKNVVPISMARFLAPGYGIAASLAIVATDGTHQWHHQAKIHEGEGWKMRYEQVKEVAGVFARAALPYVGLVVGGIIGGGVIGGYFGMGLGTIASYSWDAARDHQAKVERKILPKADNNLGPRARRAWAAFRRSA